MHTLYTVRNHGLNSMHSISTIKGRGTCRYCSVAPLLSQGVHWIEGWRGSREVSRRSEENIRAFRVTDSPMFHLCFTLFTLHCRYFNMQRRFLHGPSSGRFSKPYIHTWSHTLSLKDLTATLTFPEHCSQTSEQTGGVHAEDVHGVEDI